MISKNSEEEGDTSFKGSVALRENTLVRARSIYLRRKGEVDAFPN